MNDNNNQNQGNFYNQGNQQGNFYNPYGQQQGNFYNPNGYQQPFFDPYGQNQAMGLSKAASARTMGIAALICSLLSWCISPLIGLVLGILAIVNSSTARRMLGYEAPETKTARTLGIAAIIIAAVMFVINVIIVIAMINSGSFLAEFYYT